MCTASAQVASPVNTATQVLTPVAPVNPNAHVKPSAANVLNYQPIFNVSQLNAAANAPVVSHAQWLAQMQQRLNNAENSTIDEDMSDATALMQVNNVPIEALTEMTTSSPSEVLIAANQATLSVGSTSVAARSPAISTDHAAAP